MHQNIINLKKNQLRKETKQHKTRNDTKIKKQNKKYSYHESASGTNGPGTKGPGTKGPGTKGPGTKPPLDERSGDERSGDERSGDERSGYQIFAPMPDVALNGCELHAKPHFNFNI